MSSRVYTADHRLGGASGCFSVAVIGFWLLDCRSEATANDATTPQTPPRQDSMLPRLGKQFPTPRRRRCVSSNRYRFFSPKDRVTIPPKWQKNSGQQTFLLAPECPPVPAYHHQATRGPEPQASLDKFHQNEQIVHFAVSRRTWSRIATIWAGTPKNIVSC